MASLALPIVCPRGDSGSWEGVPSREGMAAAPSQQDRAGLGPGARCWGTAGLTVVLLGRSVAAWHSPDLRDAGLSPVCLAMNCCWNILGFVVFKSSQLQLVLLLLSI